MRIGIRFGFLLLTILPYSVQEPGIACMEYGGKNICFFLSPGHPLSGSKALYMKDLNGETMLLRTRLGFWRQITDEKMPDARFLERDEFAYDEFLRALALPSFATDVVLRREGNALNRVIIPILDEEAYVTYYCLCKSSK